MTPRAAQALRPLELAFGAPMGVDRTVKPLAPVKDLTPRRALESVVLDALRRAPCVVSFSGGQDSSAVLALAVHVARREGLDLPVPVTQVFPGAASTEEGEWQDLVLRHLGIDERVRIELTDELDAVGPVAQKILLRQGLFWPANLHFHAPILEHARGGSLLTGIGGDELGRADGALDGERVLAHRRVNGPRDVALLVYRRSPKPVKWLREYARGGTYLVDHTWLTSTARRALARQLASEYALPFGYGPLMRSYYWRRRFVQVGRRNFEALADAYDVVAHHPLLDPRTLQAMTATGGLVGHGSREAILRDVLGDLLPPGLIGRRSKAVFDDPLWTEEAMAFARSWTGHGLDHRLVDPHLVRSEWLSGSKNLLATPMMQAAWLHDHAEARSGQLPSSSTSPNSTS